MILKVGATVIVAIMLIPTLTGGGVSGAISALFGSGDSQPSATAISDIPADYLALYRAAARECQGLDWSILAAIGKIETNHGRSTLPGVHSGENSAGAGVISRGSISRTVFPALLISRFRRPASGHRK